MHIVDGRDAEIRRRAWSAADLFTSLSDNIQETFGLPPVEAMAAGLPVVITDWNGYRDTLEDGVQGIAVPTISAPPGDGQDVVAHYRSGRYSYGSYIARTAQFTAVDIDAATAAYSRLIADADLRRRMGDAGRARAYSVYDWPAIVPAYESLWDELAARQKADPEITPLAPGGANDPLRDDTPVARRAPDSIVETLARYAINSAGAGLMLSAPDLRALLAALPDADSGATTDVGRLVAEIGAPARATRRSILWLAKLGIVRLGQPE